MWRTVRFCGASLWDFLVLKFTIRYETVRHRTVRYGEEDYVKNRPKSLNLGLNYFFMIR